jgi:hypothetical protein
MRKMQGVVALSTIEVEYMAATHASKVLAFGVTPKVFSPC